MSNASLCGCGCGLPAPIATKTDRAKGITKGQPKRFVHGHHRAQRDPDPTERAVRDEVTGCLVWQGAARHGGYGVLSVGGKLVAAHRRVWEMANGPIPDGKGVLHRCDNPPCIELTHLFLGTQDDNMKDKAAKGRTRTAVAV